MSAANDGANMAAVLEKPGFLIPRDPMDEDRLPDPDPPDSTRLSRRPADFWVPGSPGAARRHGIYPFATLFADPTNVASTFAWVETRKNLIQGNASQCTQASTTIWPLVLEAVEVGWSDALRSIVAWIVALSRHVCLGSLNTRN